MQFSISLWNFAPWPHFQTVLLNGILGETTGKATRMPNKMILIPPVPTGRKVNKGAVPTVVMGMEMSMK